jgi:2,3-bisphosphoglycerate-independent phosphoglycerate mutase
MFPICLRSQSYCVRSKTEEAKAYRLRTDGSLCDIAPAILSLLKMGLPKEMTGGDMRVPLAK